jgi:hypothetical protein
MLDVRAVSRSLSLTRRQTILSNQKKVPTLDIKATASVARAWLVVKEDLMLTTQNLTMSSIRYVEHHTN